MQPINIETVTIFRTWVSIADTLADAERGKLYHALCRYSLFGELPELSGVIASYFELMRPSLDKSNRRKAAQSASIEARRQKPQNDLQNDLQNGLQKPLQNIPQTDLQKPPQPAPQTDLQKPPQNGLQNDITRVCKTVTVTVTGTVKKEPKGSQKKSPSKSFADQIPEQLKTPEFAAQWLEWENFRRKKRCAVSQIAATKQFKLLAEYDATTAAAIIAFSIANDYQGLFPPKNRPAASTNGRRDYSGI